jgi:hypothetical protein
MQRANFTNVFDAVSARRSYWMRQRGQISVSNPTAGRVQVFYNGMLVGDAGYLRRVSVADVRSVQYLSASEAASRFGLQTKSGPAIVVHALNGG